MLPSYAVIRAIISPSNRFAGHKSDHLPVKPFPMIDHLTAKLIQMSDHLTAKTMSTEELSPTVWGIFSILGDRLPTRKSVTLGKICLYHKGRQVISYGDF